MVRHGGIERIESDALTAFSSDLGWMGLKLQGHMIQRLTFGHASAEAAINAIAPTEVCCEKLTVWQSQVVLRLQRYAEGERDDFRDLAVDLDGYTEFQARVLNACRKIPYGKAVTYGELAEKSHAAGAARAVGSCMAGNRVPLIIPCHRVVRAGGEIGPYSAVGGTETKRRLLEMEAAGRREPVLA